MSGVGSARRLLALFGLCDLATGLALLAAPAALFRLPGLGPAPADPIFVRWIGVFVASVGASYLYPWLGARQWLPARLGTIAEVTALQRTAVALFVAVAVVTGALAPGWLGVAAFDGAVAAAQVAIVRGGWLDAA